MFRRSLHLHQVARLPTLIEGCLGWAVEPEDGEVANGQALVASFAAYFAVFSATLAAAASSLRLASATMALHSCGVTDFRSACLAWTKS